jgi:hypothetical protein
MSIDPLLRGSAATGLSQFLSPPMATAVEEDAPAARAPPIAANLPNPRLRLDGDLGLVVIEFLDADGKVANSLPTPREIDAYRSAVIADRPLPSELGLPGPGPLPRARDTRDAVPASEDRAASPRREPARPSRNIDI